MESFDVSAIPATWNVQASFIYKSEVPLNTDSLLEKWRTVSSGKNDKKLKWHDIPRRVITPELKMELTALKLRNYMDPKKFFKSSDLKSFPEKFHVGVVVDGGLKAVGSGKESQSANTYNKNSHKGKSLLQEALGDAAVDAWTKKKYSLKLKEVQKHKKTKRTRR